MYKKIFTLEESIGLICGDSTKLCVLYNTCKDVYNIKIYGSDGTINTLDHSVRKPYDMLLYNNTIYLLYRGQIEILSIYNKTEPIYINFGESQYLYSYTSDITLDIYQSELAIRTPYLEEKCMIHIPIILLYARMVEYGAYKYRGDNQGLCKIDRRGKITRITYDVASRLCVYNNFLYTAMLDGTVKKWNDKDIIVCQWKINDRLGYNPEFMGVIEDYLYMSYEGITYRWDKKDNMTIFAKMGFRKLVKMGDSFYGSIYNYGEFKLVFIPDFSYGIPFVNKGIVLCLIRKFKSIGIPKDIIKIILDRCKSHRDEITKS